MLKAGEYCFYEKIKVHKAILIKLKPEHQYYEVLTIFREYHYQNSAYRKPILYLSDTKYFSQEVIPFKDLEYKDFIAVLNKMESTLSSEDRFDVMASMVK